MCIWPGRVKTVILKIHAMRFTHKFLCFYARTKGPFYCPHCCLITQDSELQELKTSVNHLTKELTSLKATMAVIEKSNSDLHSSS